MSKNKDIDISGDEKSLNNIICNFCYIVSTHTHIPSWLGALLIFVEDIQLLYFVFDDEIGEKLPSGLTKIIKYVAFDNIDYLLLQRFLVFSLIVVLFVNLNNVSIICLCFILH
ncbi:hypothetical protein H8356DRAFT_1278646 [Neocallimastix lanati (nom. inval.)]|uniref:Uncharacterized protein n=1 Tax=Neocallimastix californiae TaxID=1754190 RepID=A0A1Y2FPG4_9FUNG|nr:hypothetical protein H8356DRAFT_1278646 [Neocallimastix sp. JGI-2020a]ORY84605.1 hypothetical protein LY90DRAFT_663616 [Neocallimastix californiae]|eukprot:ORY84605.1 hypothetical protein LY90DRAFT_663616 [Neocallimastix californiae]